MATLEELIHLREIYRKLYLESKSEFVRGELKKVGLKLNADIEKAKLEPVTTVQDALTAGEVAEVMEGEVQ